MLQPSRADDLNPASEVPAGEPGLTLEHRRQCTEVATAFETAIKKVSRVFSQERVHNCAVALQAMKDAPDLASAQNALVRVLENIALFGEGKLPAHSMDDVHDGGMQLVRQLQTIRALLSTADALPGASIKLNVCIDIWKRKLQALSRYLGKQS